MPVHYGSQIIYFYVLDYICLNYLHGQRSERVRGKQTNAKTNPTVHA